MSRKLFFPCYKYFLLKMLEQRSPIDDNSKGLIKSSTGTEIISFKQKLWILRVI